mgnify:CR=1 FL=1
MLTTNRRTFLRFLSSAAWPPRLSRRASIERWRYQRAIAPARSETSSTSSSSCRRTDRSITTSARLRGVRGFGDPRPVTSAVWAAGVVPAGRRRLRPAVPSRRRPTSGCSSWTTRRTAGPTRTRRGTAASTISGSPHKGRRDDGVSTRAQDIPFSLRARRRVHDLRRLPLLADGSDRSQPLPHVDRLGRQRRQRRRPGHQQRRGGLRLVDVSRAPRARRHLLEDLPGHRRRAWTPPGSGAGPTIPTSATTATTRCCTSTSTRTRMPGDAALREGARRAPTSARRPRLDAVRPAPRRRAPRPAAARCRGSSRPRPSPEHGNWPANYGAWYVSQVLDALTSNPEVWSKTALFLMLRRERRLLRSHGPADAAAVARTRPVDGRREQRDLPGQPRQPAAAPTAWASACR